jgi:hypothetical protein
LHQLQDVDIPLRVQEYVVDDEVRREIPGSKEGLPEQLFVREEDDEVEIALYIEPRIVEQLGDDDPRQRLHEGNLESFLVALEGVSHFVFLVWRANLGRPVSALEMEIQAEVDKFVTAWLWLEEQGNARRTTHGPLIRRMFDGYSIRDDVPNDEHARYHTANRAAKSYCRHLAHTYSRKAQAKGLMSDVRKFYRRGLAEKLRVA